MPDKAIDLMDEACACASLANTAVDELYIVNKKIADTQIEIDQVQTDVEKIDYEKLALLKADLEKYKKESEELCEKVSSINRDF